MGIMLAIENADNEFGAENLEVAADQAAVVGEDRAEVTEVASDIESDVADVAQADVDAEELTEIGEVAQAAVDSGEGLSEQAAEVATIAIERIHNRLGFRGKQRIVPATESFGHANTRLASTKLVVESISETIKSIWEAIKAMAKRIWDKIVQFFKKIFGSAKSLRDHLENLKKRANDMKAELKPKEKELTGALVKKISIKKKADLSTYTAIVENSMKLAKASEGLSAESSRVSAHISALTGELAASGVTDASVSKFASDMDASFKTIASLNGIAGTLRATGVAASGKAKVAKNGDTKVKDTLGPFANGQIIVISGSDRSFKVGSSTVSFEEISVTFETMNEKEFAEKAVALNRGEIIKVIDEASKVCALAEDMEKSSKGIEKVIADTQKSAENVLKSATAAAESKLTANDRVAMNEARSAIATIFTLVNQIGQRIPAALLNAAYAGADYASASIANHR